MSEDLGAAVAAHRAGRLDEAEAGYRRVLAAAPESAPESAEAHFLLGVIQLQTDRPLDALGSLRAALAVNPHDARYHNNEGKALLALGHPGEALAAFERALAETPGFANALFGRAAAFQALDRLAEAEADLRALVASQPDQAAALVNLSALLIRQNRNAEAADALEQGLARHPEDARLLANFANALEKLNELDRAEDAARRALEADPQSTQPRFSLARIDHRRGRLDRAQERLEALLEGDLLAEERLDALFELAAVHDRGARPAAAMAAYADANRRIRESPEARAISGERFLERVARNRAWFTEARLREAAARAPQAARPGPVFFVGFPRSGTTLMERALQAHPGVATTEEDSPLTPVRRHLSQLGHYPEGLEALTATEAEEAVGRFWAAAERTAGPLEGRLLVDKLPLNIVDLGLASLLFPQARILVALRDPRDVCLSCFMQYFLLNDAMVNFLDLRQTARTYAAVMDLWLHYRGRLGLPYLEYRYEDLVDDFDGVVRRVLDFIGVGWHPDVALYRDKSLGKAIATPSYRNVTDPVYSRSVGRWRAYREDLEPALDLLAPFVEAFGYPEA